MKAIAIIIADIIFRLTNLQVSNNLTKDQKASGKKIIPTLRDMTNGVSLIPGFETYFVEAPFDENGEILWPTNDNRRALPTFQYEELHDATSRILGLEDLQNIEFGPALAAVLSERERKGDYYAIPHVPRLPSESKTFESDEAAENYVSGVRLEQKQLAELMPEVANKVVFYGSRLIKILRTNGASRDFSPVSNMMIHDLANARTAVISEQREAYDDPVEIDHAAGNAGKVLTFGELLKARTNEYELDNKSYDEAYNLKEAFDAWYDIYELLDDGNTELNHVLKVKRDRAREFLDSQKKGQLFQGRVI